ncbi:MAG: hypothetical protein BAJALOKI2v1_80035 [Promethearchaeota archaeon]|nr:MAG: hypothetical protein BAJALOKI2v1_80035 [Candidatus Lokiarchaeota archaeon]
MVKMDLKSILHNRILLICLFFSSFFLGSVLLYSLPPKIRISYGLSTTTDDGIKILFDMYQPNLIENKEKCNAIILGHGFMANKRFMKDYALELGIWHQGSMRVI